MTQITDIKAAYIDRLQLLSKGLTTTEREEIYTKLGISKPTFNRYLSGDIVKFDVAEDIIAALLEAGSKPNATYL